MIERTAVLKTWEGDQVALPLANNDSRQFFLVRVVAQPIDPNGNPCFTESLVTSVHLRRETLERAGILPIARDSAVQEVEETPEDLLKRLLVRIGVVFQE